MPDQRNGSLKDKPFLKLWVSVLCVTLTVALSSCSLEAPVQREAYQADGRVQETKYSIVCVIHGDGEYLYHDTSGNAFKADEKALAGAQRVALNNPRAEVFIFHQRPRQHFLLFFPLRDGTFYYYRNGRLIAQESYWRDQGEIHLDIEVDLYHRFRADTQPGMLTVFLYFGHEIPEFGGAGYDASYPDRPFTVHDVTRELKGFQGDSTKCDLLILSTCFGGTPYTIGALGSVARYIVASPDNLHLSYFDLQPLERLDLGLQDNNVPLFAKEYARRAFDLLKGDIQTAVSVAVYDVDRVQQVIRPFQAAYEHMLTSVKSAGQESMATFEHCDCADLPTSMVPAIHAGVDVLYRPPRFGRAKEKQSHSGWECWKERIPQPPIPPSGD